MLGVVYGCKVFVDWYCFDYGCGFLIVLVRNLDDFVFGLCLVWALGDLMMLVCCLDCGVWLVALLLCVWFVVCGYWLLSRVLF